MMSKVQLSIFLVGIMANTTVEAKVASDAVKSSLQIDENGVMQIPAFSIPISCYASKEAKKAFIKSIVEPPDIGDYSDIQKMRENYDRYLIEPWLQRARALYPAKIEQHKIAGINVYEINPSNPSENSTRVLINLHGGAFMTGAGAGQLVESLPVAEVSKIKVISIDYRQGPEHKFPSASQDVVAVYKELLSHHDSKSIGIYGCSAGGLLTAMTVASLQKQGLPLPGAIGIFCSGADATWGGDSGYSASALMGLKPPSPIPNPPIFPIPYLSNVNLKDPLVSPVVSPDLLARFPPTLVITGTRSLELSSAVNTHAQLVKAGAQADLHVWDGMWHGFIYNVDLPESKDAYKIIGRFFNRHLQ